MSQVENAEMVVFFSPDSTTKAGWEEYILAQQARKAEAVINLATCAGDQDCIDLNQAIIDFVDDAGNNLLTYTGCDGGPDIYSDYPLHSPENDYVRIGCEWYTYDSTIFGNEVTDLVNYIEQWQGAAPADCTAANLYSTIQWRKCGTVATYVYTDCFVDGFPGYVIEELHDLASNPIAGCWELIGSSNVSADALIPEPMVQTACELC